jgi:hypothetical protein
VTGLTEARRRFDTRAPPIRRIQTVCGWDP